MLDNLMGDMESHQKRMLEALTSIPLSASSAEGMIRIDGNASGQVTNVQIADSLVKSNDREQIEDLLCVAMNRFYALVKEAEAKESKNMLDDLIPPGMKGMFGL